MNELHETIDTLPLTAEALCLDFVNTLDARLEPEHNELLRDYADLLRFAVRSSSMASSNVAHWMQAARTAPEQAQAVLQRARSLREALFRIFLALVETTDPDTRDIATLDAERGRAEAPHALVFTDGRFTRVWPDNPTLDRPLWPIVLSATDLLEHGDLTRIHQCDAGDCACLFLDTTRNRSRRWCTRNGCGNRTRVRQYRERQRSA